MCQAKLLMVAKKAKTPHNGSSSQNNEVESSGIKNTGKIKKHPKKLASKYGSKISSSDLSKKRKEFYPSSSSESSDDDIFVSEDPSISSSMKELSNLFSDPMSALNDGDLQRAFGMVSKVFDAPSLDDPSLRRASFVVNPSFHYSIGSLVSRLSYAISSDYQRKLLSLGKENTKLKVENSTNIELLHMAR
ncbi:uncharacterized protein LOC113309084 [Papaver somniferum]|uniref:uncharacterized protein LOC113309084 n=1 Tax=Papaver somniferum TaxID=3469 RepID=UPI000E6F4746|nr:uncharacterized protein LOC113309084 [Papaver somniferum]